MDTYTSSISVTDTLTSPGKTTPVNATTARRREADITRRDWKIETDNEPSFPAGVPGRRAYRRIGADVHRV